MIRLLTFVISAKAEIHSQSSSLPYLEIDSRLSGNDKILNLMAVGFVLIQAIA